MTTGFVVFSAIIWIGWMAIKDFGLLSFLGKKPGPKPEPLPDGVVIVDRAGAFKRLDELIACFGEWGIDAKDLRAAGRRLYDDAPVNK